MLKKALSTLLMFLTSAALAQNNSIVKSFSIGSDGGWDYLVVGPDDNLYVSHATQVNILNKTTGDSVGVISNTTGVHGIAFASDLNKGFVSNGRLNTVTIFSIKDRTVLQQVKTGENPDAIMYDPFSKMIYVCNGRSNNLTIINPIDNTVVKTVALDGKPEAAVSDDKGKIYINIEDKNEIAVLDAASYTITNNWHLAKGEAPSGLAIDKSTMRLFAGCDNKNLVIINAKTGKNIANIPIGDGCDGVAFDPELKQIYSSNGEGTLTVIKEVTKDKYQVVQNVKTQKGARTIAVDKKTHLIYLPTADFQPLAVGERRPKMQPGTFKVLVVGK